MKFASLWDYDKDESLIEGTRQVEDLLMDVAITATASADGYMDDIFWEIGFITPPPGQPQPYIRDQKVLRGWLQQIVRFNRLTLDERNALLPEIMNWAVKAYLTSSIDIVKGRFHRTYHAYFDSVQALIGEVLTRLPQLQPDAGRELVKGDVLQCLMCGTFYVISRNDDTGVCSAICKTNRSRLPPNAKKRATRLK